MKLQITAVYENKKFNCDQCGKYFARWCNLKVFIQNVHEIYSWIELWTLWQRFHQNIQFVTKPHAYEHDWHFENSNVKIVKKRSLERKSAYGKCS